MPLPRSPRCHILPSGVAVICGGLSLKSRNIPMVTASNGTRARFSDVWRSAAAAAICARLAGWPFPSAAQAPAKIPELASTSFAWLSAGGFLDPPPGVGRGPIRQDPDIPFHGNNEGPGAVTPPMGNYRDPVLKPWAAAQMRASNEEVQDGSRGLPFSAQGRCYPGGVPGQLLYTAEP